MGLRNMQYWYFILWQLTKGRLKNIQNGKPSFLLPDVTLATWCGDGEVQRVASLQILQHQHGGGQTKFSEPSSQLSAPNYLTIWLTFRPDVRQTL
jgi:hypothetical protein